MGICVTVEVEGEELDRFEVHTDGKPLADFVTSLWIQEDVAKLRRWGLPPWVVEALLKVDASGLGPDDEEPPTDAWQDPKVLGAALRALKEWRVAIRGERRLAAELDDYHFSTDEFYESHLAGLEDGVAACAWAAAQGRRVKLTAW
jgi:hypothetical protein